MQQPVAACNDCNLSISQSANNTIDNQRAMNSKQAQNSTIACSQLTEAHAPVDSMSTQTVTWNSILPKVNKLTNLFRHEVQITLTSNV